VKERGKLAFVFVGQRVEFEQSAKAFDADRAGDRLQDVGQRDETCSAPYSSTISAYSERTLRNAPDVRNRSRDS
jgi:hypothetical protein